MEELKPRLIFTKSKKSRFDLGKYIFILVVFTAGFYFGYSYKSLHTDILLDGTKKISKISQDKFNTIKLDQTINSYVQENSNLVDNSDTELVNKSEDIQQADTESSEADTSYTLQIAAFETERKSSEVVQELSSKGYNVYSISVVNSHGDRWNLVRLGNFETLEEAKEFSDLLLSSEGINSIIKSIQKSRVTSATKYY